MAGSTVVPIGESFKPFIIAEVSGNHNGSLDRAKKLIQVAANSGASAVKFQTYTASTMTIDVDAEQFKVSADHPLWGGKSLFELYEEAHTPWEWHAELFNYANDLGIIAFSTPFDATAVDFLEDLNVPLYKIASLEINDHDLITKVASTGKPVIISTGAASLNEVRSAIEVAKIAGSEKIIVLKCTSSYPSDPTDANLRAISTLRNELGIDVGLSDHTLGTSVSVAAVALGATVIEKHITLDREDGGVDSAFSLTPTELKNLVEECNIAYSALGDSEIKLRESESESFKHKRSLYIVKDVKSGETVSSENVRSIRPGGGIAPYLLHNLIGKTFNGAFSRGTALEEKMIDLS
jgi:pseudaminic acid synthase